MKEQERQLVLTILKEETGVQNPKKLRKSFRAREKKMKEMTLALKDGHERARMQRMAQNNVFAYASILNLSKEDTGFLDSQLRLIEDVIVNNNSRISLAYKVRSVDFICITPD